MTFFLFIGKFWLFFSFLSLSLSFFFGCQTPEGPGNLELDANNI